MLHAYCFQHDNTYSLYLWFVAYVCAIYNADVEVFIGSLLFTVSLLIFVLYSYLSGSGLLYTAFLSYLGTVRGYGNGSRAQPSTSEVSACGKIYWLTIASAELNSFPCLYSPSSV